MENKHPRKILKSPVAKRRSRLIPKDQKVTLERVLGFTVTSNATLACDPNTGTLAYPAGCVVVLYSPKKNKQGHIFNVSKKTITSLAFSGDGKHLVTGESGHQPAVRIWDVAEKTQVAEFLGHKFGINCVAFSPNLKYMVSIGTQHDMQVNVWNWRTGSKVASNKVSSKVTAVAFSSDGSYFVTAGMRHVKFWYLDSSKSKINATVPLNGRNGILGEHRNNFFCDVATGIGRQDKNTFCITQSGSLCQFNEKRQMDKWVELRTSCATCISAADDYLVVGCANGIVRVFDADSLHFIASLPRPHYLGVDIADAVNPSQIGPAKTDDIKYPDTIAIKFDENHRKVTCLYNDHSMYVWDVHDLKKIGKAWSFLYHSSCVYGVETYPMLENGRPSILPPNSFFTCSSDDTIRIWNLDPHMPETASYKSNIYSHDLLKVMYMDPSLASLCDVDYNPSGATDKTDTNYDDKNGIRSIRVSPDGQHLASGDRQGNVRIHELEKLIEIKQIEAHESEVLCLEYSHWKTGPKILASSSRDRLIHVFDAEQQYGLLQTLSDHSSSISAVKFTETDGNMKMISCGADKSILFRNLQQDPEFQFTLATHQVEKTTLYDMDVEPTHNFTAIACQDRNVRIYNIKNGKKKKEYKGSLSDDGTLLKMKLDPSGSYAATSSSDKNLCILDFYTGELCATMFGHSEIATDVRFMNDLRHLISTGGDGCIFVWRLPKEMTSQMQSRLADMGHDVPMTNGVPKLDDIPSLKDDVDFGVPPEREFFSPESVLKKMYSSQQQPARQLTPEEDPSYRFSISQLPSWAKKQFSEDEASTKAEEEGTVAAPRGRWAQRAEGQSLTVKQQDGKSIDVASDRRRFSFESDAVAMAQFSDARRETMVINRPSTVPKNMPVIMDEDNIDDDEDEFMPVSSTTFIKPDMNRDVTWDDLYNFENDADGPESQIIYYPPSESDGSDTLASSYQVFNAGINNSGTAKQLRHSLSINSNPDADSESTDPVSLEDMDEDEDSNNSTPSTPLDDMVSKSKTREKFLKETFENLSFTPSLPTDKFLKGLDTMEEEMENTQPTAAINSRQSLSARFLSKANTRGPYGNIPRQDNWFDSVQRRKDDMARNLDESRKMLMAMGWKQESPEADAEDPFADPPTIPTSPPHDTTPKAGRVLSDIDEKKTSLTLNLHNVPEPVASIGSPRTPKTLRRCWSNLDLPKTPIPEVVSEENATKKTTPRKPIQRSASSCSITNKPGKDTATTPTSRKSLSSQVRPRTLPLDRSGGRVTPTDKSTNQKTGRTSVANRKPTPTASSTMTGVDSKLKTSRLSAPIMSKVEIDFEPRRASSGSNLSKAKSNSMHSLTFQEDEQELTPRGTNRKPRSKWSKSNLSSFASVPNLLQPDDDGRISLKCYSDDSSSVDTIKTDPDLNDNVFKKTKSSVRKSNQQSSKSDNSLAANARRSVSASRLSGGSTSRDPSVEEKKPMNRKVGSSAGNLQSASGNKKPKDRDLMPPPPIPNASAKARQERIAKRANDPRRKTTDNSGFSLEEAKDILSGKSIKITEIKEKARRKRSSSSSPKRDRVKSTSSIEKQSSVKNDFVQITDPGVLDATSEIEMTAAEIQRKSAPATNSVSLEASPNDPPERDIPCERDGPRTRSRVSKSATGINKTNVKPKSEPVITNGENSDSARDSGLSTQEDEDCPSPSVKDRIARLNKRVIDTDRQSSVSPCRGPIHSQTASVDSTRKSSVQFNLSSDSSAKSTVTSETSASILAMTNSSVAMETVNVSHDISSPKTANTFQSNSVSESNIDIFSKNTHSVAPAAQELSCSTQSLSPPSGLGTSMDSEGLASNLSPGNHSNGSPRSVADTGLGSDTDLETSQTFKRDQLSGSGGAPALLIDALREQQSLSDRIVSLYAQVQNRQDEESLDAKREINQQLPMLIQSLMDGVGINMPVSTHEDSVTLPRSMLHNIIQGVKNIEEFFDK